MATQLMLQFTSLVPVDPAEDSRIVLWCTAVRNAIRPVLGETVLAGGGLQAGSAHLYTHDHIRFSVLSVVAPQRVQLLLHAAFACKKGESE